MVSGDVQEYSLYAIGSKLQLNSFHLDQREEEKKKERHRLISNSNPSLIVLLLF